MAQFCDEVSIYRYGKEIVRISQIHKFYGIHLHMYALTQTYIYIYIYI